MSALVPLLCDNQTYSIYDVEMKVERFERRFWFAQSSSEGIAVAIEAEGKSVLIHSEGFREVTLDSGLSTYGSFSNGMLLVKTQSVGEEEKFGYVNENGEMVIEPRFSFAFFMDRAGSTVKVHSKDRRLQRITKDGVLVGDRYDHIVPFHKDGDCSGALVHKNGSPFMSIIDGNGERRTSKQFRAVNQGIDGLVPVAFMDDSIGWVDYDGNDVSKLEMRDVGFHFQDKHIPVQNHNGKWGLMNLDCEWTIDPVFDLVEPVGKSRFRLVSDINGGRTSRLADSTGRIVSELNFVEIYCFSDGVACVSQGGRFEGTCLENYILDDGTIILPKWNQLEF